MKISNFYLYFIFLFFMCLSNAADDDYQKLADLQKAISDGETRLGGVKEDKKKLLEKLGLKEVSEITPNTDVQFTKGDGSEEKNFEDRLLEMGFGWGVGLIMVEDDKREVISSSSPDGVLNVEWGSSARTGFMLEQHFLFDDDTYKRLLEIKNTKNSKSVPLESLSQKDIESLGMLTFWDFLYGPYVGLELGDEIVNSFGVGGMLSWRRVYVDDASKIVKGRHFNICLGLQVDPSVDMLANGFSEGMEVDVGTVARTQQDKQVGLAIMFSTNF